MKNREGEINKNSFGTSMKIIEYKNANNIIVEFLDDYKINKRTTYQSFTKGNVTNPYDKTIYGNGCIGFGKYNKTSTHYTHWKTMMQRCDNERQNIQCSYKGCIVCSDWTNYQNFAKWCEENYYEVADEKMQLDKDILNKGNRIYSSCNCVFVPQNINLLFTKCDKSRGNYLIGVDYNRNMYRARCRDIDSRQVDLGRFDTEVKAFMAYKTFKEKIIKQTADKYKNIIPPNLFQAMHKYQVEITD